MLDPTARETWGCYSSSSPSPASSKDGDVFPVGTRTQSTHIHHIYINMCVYMCVYIYICLATQITGRDSEHTLKHRQHQQPHAAPLSAWEEGRFTSENICMCIRTYMYRVNLSSNWPQTLNLPSSCPWIPVSPAAGTWTYEAQPYSMYWYKPSRTQSWLGFPWSHSRPPCATSPTHRPIQAERLAFTTSLAHPRLLQLLSNWQRGPPLVWLQLLDPDPIHICAHRTDSLHPGKRKEFNQTTGHIMLQVPGTARQVYWPAS